MRRIAALAALAAVAAGCSGHRDRTLGGYGVELQLARGWYGVSGPGQLQAADFPLKREVLESASRAKVGRGQVHVIVWDGGPAVPYLAANHPGRGSFYLHPSDLSGPFEGFPSGHVYAQSSTMDREELLDVLVDLGPGPISPDRLGKVNRLLATLRVAPPEVRRPQAGRLRDDGITLELPPSWTGRLELPAAKHATRVVIRAAHGPTRIVLLELPLSFRARKTSLPVALTEANRVRSPGARVARRVFEANGRSFDLSVVYRSRQDLAEANQVLATLRVER